MLDRIKSLFPRAYGRYVLEKVYRYSYYKRIHQSRLQDIKERKKAHVLFVLSSLSIWRFEDVCRLLMEDERFVVHLVICPFADLADIQKKEYTDQLVAYCERLHWPFTIKGNSDSNLIDLINPDIIFYPQMFHELYGNELDCEKNLDRLLVYVPYGLITVSGDWVYNSRFINNSWKFYLPTSLHLEYGRKHSYIKGRNMEVVGDPHAKAFLTESGNDPWKKQDCPKKRIIWAPHFSVNQDGHLNRGSFLWMHGFMREIAEKYKEEIQFVFKPHPWLLSALYRHPDWGETRTNEYYDFWKNGSNTQLEIGAYLDLFRTSDALIHDCGSFTAEYHYTAKPVLFVSRDFDGIYQGLDTFGSLCMDLHYHACETKEILSFIQNVVLEGKDPRKADRVDFRNQYLLPKKGFPFEQNVFSSMAASLFKE